jgi:glutathione synthase/RimK-type ligase-like ATP-grasp enzyme
MAENKKIGLYFPAKDRGKPRNYFSNPGVLEKDVQVKLLEKIKQKFSNWEIIEDLDFKQFSIVKNEIIFEDKPLDLDVYFWYSFADLSKDSYNMHCLKLLRKKCNVAVNPFALEVITDKYLAHTALCANGFDVADFAFVSSNNIDYAEKILKKWEKVVVKPRFGSYGIGTMLVEDFSTLRDLFGILKENLNKDEIPLLLEKFYPNDISKWVSITVIGNKAVYGYRKKKEKFVDGWKVFDDKKDQNNPKTVDYVDPGYGLKKIAEKASLALKADIVGFDFIKTNEGFKIVDENSKPGFYTHCFKKAGVNLEDAILSLIKV